MKTFLLLSISLLILFPTNVFSQKLKYGYLNADKVLAEMPEIGKANKELEGFIKQVNDYISTKNKEYQTKLADFQKNEKTYSELIKTDKSNELSKMANDIKQFQLTAQTEINKKKQELYKAAIVKLKEAIKKVAKKNAYRFIIDNSNGQLLYAEEGDNVENLVKKELGITN